MTEYPQGTCKICATRPRPKKHELAGPRKKPPAQREPARTSPEPTEPAFCLLNENTGPADTLTKSPKNIRKFFYFPRKHRPRRRSHQTAADHASRPLSPVFHLLPGISSCQHQPVVVEHTACTCHRDRFYCLCRTGKQSPTGGAKEPTNYSGACPA